MGGQMVEGTVMKAEDARRIYEDIVRRRRDPGLLEWAGRGLFQARVFPIEPHADLTIRLTFQQVLPEDDGTLEFRYPLATSRLGAAPVENVLVDVVVKSDVDLRAVYSPSHDVGVVREGERSARITYERAGRVQDRDFLLYVSRSPDDVGFSLISHKAPGEDGTFMAVIAPRTEVAAGALQPKDVVFVIDTSGSMAGPKIEQARRALVFGVRTLQPQDRFSVVAFSTGVHAFRDGLAAATPDVREAAVQWIEALQAGGGTNIEAALRHALSQLAPGRLPMVVFLTDGRPSVQTQDAEALVKIAEGDNRAKARIFTFGVGHDLDVRLLDRLAESSRGARDYVTPEEDIEVVTGRFFRKVQQPVMTNVRIELGEGVHDVYPTQLPDLFAGGQVSVLGRYRTPGVRTILLRGVVAGREVVIEHSATLASDPTAPFLPRLWAHRKVAFLLDQIRLHGANAELVDEVVRLATHHGIVTPYTAGLVVEEAEGRAGDGGGRSWTGRDLPRPEPSPRGDAGDRFRGPSGAAAPGVLPPPATATPTPAEETAASDDLSRRKDADAAPEADPGTATAKAAERVQTVEGKTFLRDADGRWVDTAYDAAKHTEITKVVAYSDDWFALTRKADAISRWLAVGDRLIVVVDGKAHEIVP
jgi:Ca-activated chloride channel family protein